MTERFPVSARRRAYERGAVTINFLYPFTTAPTTGQMINTPYNTVIATVVASAAADTSAVITHDFGLPASDITQGFPQLTIVPQGDETTSPWYEASENPNYTVLQKNTLGAGPTVKVFVQRPHSIAR
jgi:hypothetical protein